jgi:hypothetical protein
VGEPPQNTIYLELCLSKYDSRSFTINIAGNIHDYIGYTYAFSFGTGGSDIIAKKEQCWWYGGLVGR